MRGQSDSGSPESILYGHDNHVLRNAKTAKIKLWENQYRRVAAIRQARINGLGFEDFLEIAQGDDNKRKKYGLKPQQINSYYDFDFSGGQFTGDSLHLTAYFRCLQDLYPFGTWVCLQEASFSTDSSCREGRIIRHLIRTAPAEIITMVQWQKNETTQLVEKPLDSAASYYWFPPEETLPAYPEPIQ